MGACVSSGTDPAPVKVQITKSAEPPVRCSSPGACNLQGGRTEAPAGPADEGSRGGQDAPHAACTVVHVLVLPLQHLACIHERALEAAVPMLVSLGAAAGEGTADAGVRQALHAALSALSGVHPASSAGMRGPNATPPFLRVVGVEGAGGEGGPGHRQQGDGGGAPQGPLPRHVARLRRLFASDERARDAVAALASQWVRGATCKVSAASDGSSSAALVKITADFFTGDDGLPHPALSIALAEVAQPAAAPSDGRSSGVAAVPPQGGGSAGGVGLGSAHAAVMAVGWERQPEVAAAARPKQAVESAWAEQASRGLSILSSVPLIATLLEVDGGAVFQNELSRSYWGDLCSGGSSDGRQARPSCEDVLTALLVCKPDAVEEILDSVQHKEARRMMLQAPATCNPRDLGSPRRGAIAGATDAAISMRSPLGSQQQEQQQQQQQQEQQQEQQQQQQEQQQKQQQQEQERGQAQQRQRQEQRKQEQEQAQGQAWEAGETSKGEMAVTSPRGRYAGHSMPGSMPYPATGAGLAAAAGAAGRRPSGEASSPPVAPRSPAAMRGSAPGHGGGRFDAGPGDRTGLLPAAGSLPLSPGRYLEAAGAGGGAANHVRFSADVQHHHGSAGPSTGSDSARRSNCFVGASSANSSSHGLLTMGRKSTDNDELLVVQPSLKLRSLLAVHDEAAQAGVEQSPEASWRSASLSSRSHHAATATYPSKSGLGAAAGGSSRVVQLSGSINGAVMRMTSAPSGPRTESTVPATAASDGGAVLAGAAAAPLLPPQQQQASDRKQQQQQQRQQQEERQDSPRACAAAAATEAGVGGGAPAATGSSARPLEASEEMSWQEVELQPFVDPVTGRDMVLLIQMDISERVEMEMRLNAVSETQLNIMEQMFPRHVLEHMIRVSAGQSVEAQPISASGLATSHDHVTVLFCDIHGFTTMSKEVPPAAVMSFLNSLFTLLDELIDQYEVYKVETAGDCYIVAGSLMCIDDEGFLALDPDADAREGAQKVMAFAKAMLRCAKTVTMPHNGQPTTVRVGMHTGPVVTGLIGTKLPKFSVFGDTMNTASRMESTCRHGCIQVSAATRALLTTHTFTPTGGVEVKGKGLMETYLWIPEEHPEEEYKTVREQAQEATALLKHINNTMSRAPASRQASGVSANGPSRQGSNIGGTRGSAYLFDRHSTSSLSRLSFDEGGAAGATPSRGGGSGSGAAGSSGGGGGCGPSLLALSPLMAQQMQAQLARPRPSRRATMMQLVDPAAAAPGAGGALPAATSAGALALTAPASPKKARAYQRQQSLHIVTFRPGEPGPGKEDGGSGPAQLPPRLTGEEPLARRLSVGVLRRERSKGRLSQGADSSGSAAAPAAVPPHRLGSGLTASSARPPSSEFHAVGGRPAVTTSPRRSPAAGVPSPKHRARARRASGSSFEALHALLARAEESAAWPALGAAGPAAAAAAAAAAREHPPTYPGASCTRPRRPPRRSSSVVRFPHTNLMLTEVSQLASAAQRAQVAHLRGILSLQLQPQQSAAEAAAAAPQPAHADGSHEKAVTRGGRSARVSGGSDAIVSGHVADSGVRLDPAAAQLHATVPLETSVHSHHASAELSQPLSQR